VWVEGRNGLMAKELLQNRAKLYGAGAGSSVMQTGEAAIVEGGITGQYATVNKIGTGKFNNNRFAIGKQEVSGREEAVSR